MLAIGDLRRPALACRGLERRTLLLPLVVQPAELLSPMAVIDWLTHLYIFPRTDLSVKNRDEEVGNQCPLQPP